MNFIPCDNCKNEKIPGYIHKVIDGYTYVVECDCHKKWREENELERKCISVNIRPDYKWEDYKGKKSIDSLNCLKELSNNFKNYIYKTMIYLYGPNSTQKTSMVQVLGKELISKGYKVFYTTMNDLINALVRDFNTSDEENERKDYFIKRCTECDLLILDESFDPTKVTIYKSGYQIPYLDNFLRSRYDISKKSILFISNVKSSEIEDKGYGRSLQEFVMRNTAESTLTFEDNIRKNANANMNPLGLFNKEAK